MHGTQKGGEKMKRLKEIFKSGKRVVVAQRKYVNQRYEIVHFLNLFNQLLLLAGHLTEAELYSGRHQRVLVYG
jgi:hypothetical protein